MKIYLCGGINGLTDEECYGWREKAKELLNHPTIDPTRRDYRGKEDESVDAIIDGDKKDIDDADILLVNATRPSWGTAMEIMYAFERNKPVYSIVGDKISPWLRYHSTLLSDSLESSVFAINALSWCRK